MIAHRLALCIALVVSAGASIAGRADAQSYPDRLIKIVVPYPPGGPIDITARLVAQRLGPILGQTVIIENRGGAGGALGTKAAAGAEPDGYTLLFGNASAFVVGPAVYRFRDYDTLKQFTPIAKVTEGYEVLVVAPDFPPKNVQELIAYAKAHPGKLNFGSMGYGNLTHLVAELFKLQTGTDFVHVPYKGSPEAVAGIVSGQVHILFGEVAGLLPLVREGKLRALGVASVGRNALAPELPTMIGRGGAQGHARANRDQAQRRHQRKPQAPRGRRRARQARRRGAAGLAGGVRRLPRQGTRQVGRRGHPHRHQGGVRRGQETAATPCPTPRARCRPRGGAWRPRRRCPWCCRRCRWRSRIAGSTRAAQARHICSPPRCGA
jgi:tripartite-type tricarboxylate transporter receptor subunit TctC